MPTDLTIEKLRVWLLDRREKAQAKRFVIGLSGGIDSAVVAALCARADKANTILVMLPCFSDPKSEEDARIVAAAIGVEPIKIELEAAHTALWSATDKVMDDGRWSRDGQRDETADTNIRSRLRMVALYGVANALNGIVVGTDNACENYVGFFTKYGDGGVDVNPIARYLKSQVRELGYRLGIPHSIVIKVPTADLRYNLLSGRPNTDEDEMGVTYEALDAYLQCHGSVPGDVAGRIERMHDATQHKRETPYEPFEDYIG